MSRHVVILGPETKTELSVVLVQLKVKKEIRCYGLILSWIQKVLALFIPELKKLQGAVTIHRPPGC